MECLFFNGIYGVWSYCVGIVQNVSKGGESLVYLFSMRAVLFYISISLDKHILR